jgi:type II secretory pathway pseudopilin PulG
MHMIHHMRPALQFAGLVFRPQARGFTLFETIICIGLLGLVSAGILTIQPQIFKTQTMGRDEYVGLELAQACAERLLGTRRTVGFGSVTDTLCNGMGGLGGFAANPRVALTVAGGASAAACSTATCTASITVSKTSGPPAALGALTVELRSY